MKEYLDRTGLQTFAEGLTSVFAPISAVGSPLVASIVADMTDTSKVYVYTGTEAGYTSGDWYYYDGAAWVSGGVYNAVAVVTDKTLSLSGVAADAKATGDAIDILDDLLDISKTEGTIFNSYTNGTSTSIPGNSPFIIHKLEGGHNVYITGIKINIKTGGTLSVGIIAKNDVTLGETFDSNDAIVKESLQINSTGEITVNITPFLLDSNHYLFIGMPTDTAYFYYGGSGAQTQGFYYISLGKYTNTNSFLGIDVYGMTLSVPSNIRELIDSVYKGKTLSILGDSISTFSGYIPEGNATYYPAGTVQSVNDTWWKKLMDALGMTLNVNNSWSGSRVTTTAGDTSAGCMTRCQNLGTDPDVIIVWMGINDFNNEVALGSYDGTTELPTVTTTFREAYAIMLNKILTAYQSAEIWVCTLPQCERNSETGFPEINGNGVALATFNKAILELADAFGVKVLDHNKCGLTYQNMPVYNPDNLHPNKYGHSLVANNDIWQMDSSVKKRY